MITLEFLCVEKVAAEDLRELFFQKRFDHLFRLQLQKDLFERVIAFDFFHGSGPDQSTLLDNGNLVTEFFRNVQNVR